MKRANFGLQLMFLSTLAVTSLGFADEPTTQTEAQNLPPLTPSRLERRLLRELRNPTVSEALKTRMRARRVMLVAGFLNQATSRKLSLIKASNGTFLERPYFAATSQSLRDDFGMPQPLEIFPETLPRTSIENADHLAKDVEREYAKTHLPLLVIGYSKGASEAVYMALRHPELIISGKIDRVISVQGAFYGSRVNTAKLKQYPILDKISGFHDMDPKNARATTEEVIRTFKSKVSTEEAARISKRIYYVRASLSDAGKIPNSRTFRYKILAGTPSDGTLDTEDEKLNGEGADIGVDLGVLEGDHTDFISEPKPDHSPKFLKMAFLRALLGEIFE